MDVPSEIAKRVESLPPHLQAQVLRFVDSLAAPVQGQPGAALLRFASTIDPESARRMSEAIEEACERVDPDEW